MIAECARCGAPLDVREGSSLTKCRYCGQTNRTDTMRTVLPQTPRDWRPPPTWTPPPHAPAPSDVVLRYQSSAGAVAIVVWIVGVVFMVGVSAFVALFARKGPGSFGGGSPGSAYVDPKAVAPERLAKLTMRESLATIAGKLGLTSNDEKRLRVPLKDSPWDAVLFEWEDADKQHVAEFTLTASAPVPEAKAIRKAMTDALPPRWDNEEYFRWVGVTVYVPKDQKMISVHVTVDDERGAGWRTQTEVLWAIIGNAALGFDAKVDADGVRDFLGGGKPIVELAKLDPDVDVDGAQKAVVAIFPGATVQKAGGLDFTVPLDHPVWREVELSWPNEKAAKLQRMYFRPQGQKVKAQAQLAKCFEKALGTTARTMESDHLAKKVDYLFDLPNGGELRLYDHMLMLTVHAWWGAPMPKASWPKNLKAIDDCGRELPPSATNR